MNVLIVFIALFLISNVSSQCLDNSGVSYSPGSTYKTSEGSANVFYMCQGSDSSSYWLRSTDGLNYQKYGGRPSNLQKVTFASIQNVPLDISTPRALPVNLLYTFKLASSNIDSGDQSRFRAICESTPNSYLTFSLKPDGLVIESSTDAISYNKSPLIPFTKDSLSKDFGNYSIECKRMDAIYCTVQSKNNCIFYNSPGTRTNLANSNDSVNVNVFNKEDSIKYNADGLIINDSSPYKIELNKKYVIDSATNRYFIFNYDSHIEVYEYTPASVSMPVKEVDVPALTETVSDNIDLSCQASSQFPSFEGHFKYDGSTSIVNTDSFVLSFNNPYLQSDTVGSFRVVSSLGFKLNGYNQNVVNYCNDSLGVYFIIINPDGSYNYYDMSALDLAYVVNPLALGTYDLQNNIIHLESKAFKLGGRVISFSNNYSYENLTKFYLSGIREYVIDSTQSNYSGNFVHLNPRIQFYDNGEIATMIYNYGDYMYSFATFRSMPNVDPNQTVFKSAITLSSPNFDSLRLPGNKDGYNAYKNVFYNACRELNVTHRCALDVANSYRESSLSNVSSCGGDYGPMQIREPTARSIYRSNRYFQSVFNLEQDFVNNIASLKEVGQCGGGNPNSGVLDPTANIYAGVALYETEYRSVYRVVPDEMVASYFAYIAYHIGGRAAQNAAQEWWNGNGNLQDVIRSSCEAVYRSSRPFCDVAANTAAAKYALYLYMTNQINEWKVNGYQGQSIEDVKDLLAQRRAQKGSISTS